jgi:hypothetical protein
MQITCNTLLRVAGLQLYLAMDDLPTCCMQYSSLWWMMPSQHQPPCHFAELDGLLLCSPSASYKPTSNDSHGHLHRLPNLMETAATCGLHISWSQPLVRRRCSPRRRTAIPCLRCSQHPPSCSPPWHGRTSSRRHVLFWAHGAAAGLPPVPHVSPPRHTPPRTPSRQS